MTKLDNNLLLSPPFKLDFAGSATVLALGAELKSSICAIENGTVYISKTGAGLMEVDGYRGYIGIVEAFLNSMDACPDLVVCDMHPGYSSTRYALSLEFKKLQVQHHYAHIVACMVENNLEGPVLGIAADGTGYGTDGAIWGCEVLKCDLSGFERLGHLKYFKLFGGDAASIETWRPAAGLMAVTFGNDFTFKNTDNQALEIAKKRINSGSGLVKTSSLGRLFDGVSFLLGLCDKNNIEAQAAIALENAAASAKDLQKLEYKLTEDGNGCIEMDFRPIITDIIHYRDNGVPVELIAAGFHQAIAKMLIDCAKKASERTGIKNIAISGGCFLNKILTKTIEKLGKEKDLSIYAHKLTSPGDGCIAFGQACIGAYRLLNN